MATSALTNIIYAGTVDSTGRGWATQADVTDAALGAVCEHVVERLKRERADAVVVTQDGEPVFEITVRVLGPGAKS